MALHVLVIGHSPAKYLSDYLSFEQYSVFSYSGYRTLKFLQEDVLFDVAHFLSVVGANDIGVKSPETIADDIECLCDVIHGTSPSATVFVSTVCQDVRTGSKVVLCRSRTSATGTTMHVTYSLEKDLPKMEETVVRKRNASCIVHDHRWKPTYLYLLNQCHNSLNVPRKDGKQFTDFLCTCDDSVTDHLISEDKLPLVLAETIATLRSWPPECVVILQPVIFQLEKLTCSDIRPSLMKFLYCVDKCCHGNMDFLSEATQNCRLSEKNQNAVVQDVGQSSITAGEVQDVSQSSINAGEVQDVGQSSITAGENTTGSATSPSHSITAPVNRNPGCVFHGSSYKFVFQYILNTLHKRSYLPTKLIRPFSRAVCICGGSFDWTKLYTSVDYAVQDVKYMNTVLDKWEHKAGMRPIRGQLTNAADTHDIPDGLMALAFYFKKAHTKDNRRFQEIFATMKKPKE